MTGTTRTITRTALPKIPQGHRVGSIEFFGVGPGRTILGSYEYLAVSGSIQTAGSTASGFVVLGKWLALERPEISRQKRAARAARQATQPADLPLRFRIHNS
jgi:hypothetical protein